MRSAVWRLAVLVGCGLTGVSLLSQAPTTSRSDAAMSGVVTDAVSGEPLPDAVVRLGRLRDSDFPESELNQVTDTKGRFVFIDLPAADYWVDVERHGYFVGAYGQAAAYGDRRRIPLRDGQWFDSANVALYRHSSISGVVTDEHGEPLVNVMVRAVARVTVAGTERLAAGKITRTDDRGVYRLSGLSAGRYVVMVPSAPASFPGSNLRDLATNALAVQRRGGRGVPTEPAIGISDATRRLVLGGYPVPPPSSGGTVFTYPIAFAGGASIATARTIVLEAGRDANGVDVQLVPTSAVTVSGRVDGPAEAIKGLTLRLLAEGLDNTAPGHEAGIAGVAADGTFSFPLVPAGTYAIDAAVQFGHYTARTSSESMFYDLPVLPAPGLRSANGTIGSALPGTPGIGFEGSQATSGYWGRLAVTVGAQAVENLVVPLKPALTVQGRIVEEPAPGKPEETRYVRLEPASGDPRLGVPRSKTGGRSESFVIPNVLPGAFVFRAEGSVWMIKSVVSEGRDYADTAIDLTGDVNDVVVTVTKAIPALDGTVRDRSGKAVTESSAVIVFPVERAQWTNYGLEPRRILSTLTAADGTFRFRAIPAGEYAIVAAPAGQVNAWQDPEFLARVFPQASRVAIAWGERKHLDVRLPEPR